MGHVLVAATVIESRCDEKHGKPLVGEVVDWHRVGAKNALHALLLAETRSVLRQRVVRLTLRRAQVISERFRERWRGHTRENRRSLLGVARPTLCLAWRRIRALCPSAARSERGGSAQHACVLGYELYDARRPPALCHSCRSATVAEKDSDPV